MTIRFSAATTATALLLAATGANATTLVSSYSHVTATPSSVPPLVGMTLITEFDSTIIAGNPVLTVASGFTFTQDALSYTRDGVLGLDPGVSAPPPYDTVAGSNYETVLSGGTAVLKSLQGMSAFSFYLGSPDDYNFVTFYALGDTAHLHGQQLSGAAIWDDTGHVNGNQSVGYRVNYVFNQKIGEIAFHSTGNSFEFDSLGATAVPEPASWALMVGGFGLMGAALRRRRVGALPA